MKTLTGGAVTTEAGSLFQYYSTTLTEKGDHLLRRWLVPCMPSKAAKSGREKKTSSDQYSRDREYLKCGNRVDPSPSPLQSVVVGQATNASYQLCR